MERGLLPPNPDVEKSPDFAAIMKNLMSRISVSGLSKEKEETIIQQLKTLKKHQHIFLKNQFLYDTMKVYCAGDNSGKPLLDKTGAIIATEELPSHIRIRKLSPLTPEEVQELRYIAAERIIVRSAHVKNLMYESGLQVAEWLPLSEGEKIVTKAKKILSEDFKAYYTAAHLYLDKTLTLWHTCDKSYNAYLSNLNWLEKRCSLHHLKLRILECRISLAFYSEEPQQIEALELLEVLLKEKLSELRTELQKLQSTTTQYNMLKGTEYDAILHQYIDVLRKLKEQAWTLNQMSNS
ncbi:uncharacterized protein LOC126094779 isoform X1 [Schistocerca cancellata]|uniref:uncharacterized protein LOC126094779 isoform X1 n=2 Tax=Schistocerca cancellata TaxID=274614 RepID=UPI00211797C4|nr:uncharacterized protein LOC126094779 isoform X1 [Schistocerca cancellata]